MKASDILPEATPEDQAILDGLLQAIGLSHNRIDPTDFNMQQVDVLRKAAKDAGIAWYEAKTAFTTGPAEDLDKLIHGDIRWYAEGQEAQVRYDALLADVFTKADALLKIVTQVALAGLEMAVLVDGQACERLDRLEADIKDCKATIVGVAKESGTYDRIKAAAGGATARAAADETVDQ